MKIFDNITDIVRDDLKRTIQRGSKVSIAAACFSMYAYKELKSQLEQIDEFRFIFTSPTFVREQTEKQRREFYIPRLSRETSLYGTEFEIKLRNEMTQRAVAEWMYHCGYRLRTWQQQLQYGQPYGGTIFHSIYAAVRNTLE